MRFDSRNSQCKSPFGAAVCGAEVSFRLLGREDYAAAQLVARFEFAGQDHTVPLSPAGDNFAGTLCAPDAAELIWYCFRLERADGRVLWLGKDGLAGREDGLPRWQLTVYDDARPAPDWFGRGVSYQIFPDRFCRLAVPDARGMVGDRLVHADWDELPAFGPDETGEVRCRDFFGGSLAGICSKLDYLASLSVTTLYLCPIFESASNHRYNTADYRAIDPMLGAEEDFRTLCREAEKRGIRVLLDGVFNHNGRAATSTPTASTRSWARRRARTRPTTRGTASRTGRTATTRGGACTPSLL